jgi:DNA polymerase III delta subunit
MITLLTGTDNFLLMYQKRALVRAFLATQADGEVSMFDFADDAHSSQVRRALEASEEDLFAFPKLIFLRQPSALTEEAQDALLESIQTKPDTSWVIIEPGNLKKTDAYTKKLAILAELERVICDVSSESERGKVLDRLLNENPSVRFEAPARQLFLLRVGGDTAKLYSEFEKLFLYKKEGAITSTDVEVMLEPTLEDTGFQALDALARGDKPKATLLFRNLFLWKKDALPILGLCAWQIRQLILLREVYDQGVRQSEAMAREVSISPYVVSKLAPLLPAFPLTRLAQAHALILEYDRDIKQGLVEQGTAIDLFVWKM